MSDRKTISTSEGVHERLVAERDRAGDDSLSDTIDRLLEAAEGTKPTDGGREQTDEQMELLTVDHIDDIVAQTSRETADEVENRLTHR
ncbi:antitoxin VapB family protein [Saliphagus sp. LR7]|uniref:antitoxin VapB family protein n=1 Tax=Saliphagus sp. LR7 TaxID=2282654 RepID=UPI000DF763FA|nr:antitoxin VapB family protein [Saliphagus sp. LR7]